MYTWISFRDGAEQIIILLFLFNCLTTISEKWSVMSSPQLNLNILINSGKRKQYGYEEIFYLKDKLLLLQYKTKFKFKKTILHFDAEVFYSQFIFFIFFRPLALNHLLVVPFMAMEIFK